MSAISNEGADKKKLAFLKSVKALGGKSAKSKMKIHCWREPVEKEAHSNEASCQPASVSGLESRIEQGRDDDRGLATQNFKRGSMQPPDSYSHLSRLLSREAVKVQILKDRFEPTKVVVPVGSTVEWAIELDKSNLELNSRSLYHGKARMHVISFDTLPDESAPLRSPEDKFSVCFTEPGTFTYRCPIYTWMQGSVVVVGGAAGNKKRRSMLEEQSIDQIIKSVKPGKPFEYVEHLSEEAEEGKEPNPENLD